MAVAIILNSLLFNSALCIIYIRYNLFDSYTLLILSSYLNLNFIRTD